MLVVYMRRFDVYAISMVVSTNLPVRFRATAAQTVSMGSDRKNTESTETDMSKDR